MRASGPRPAGADNYLRWRRTIDEHLELRRISMLEYAMFSWLCTKADPRTGLVRTNWLTLAQQTGLTANHIEKLCRSLRHKGYVGIPSIAARVACSWNWPSTSSRWPMAVTRRSGVVLWAGSESAGGGPGGPAGGGAGGSAGGTRW